MATSSWHEQECRCLNNPTFTKAEHGHQDAVDFRGEYFLGNANNSNTATAYSRVPAIYNVQARHEIYVELTTIKVKWKNYETLQMMSAWEAHRKRSLISHQRTTETKKYFPTSTL